MAGVPWSGGQSDRNGNLGATAFSPGAMTSQINSNPWQPYFGEPVRELKLNPYSNYGRENWTLPDAYTGSIPFMTQLMIHIIAEEDLWPTKVVCPIRITESEMEVRGCAPWTPAVADVLRAGGLE